MRRKILIFYSLLYINIFPLIGSSYDLEDELLIFHKLLVVNGYKTPDDKIFSERCLRYYGVTDDNTTYISIAEIYIINEYNYIKPETESIFYAPWLDSGLYEDESEAIKNFTENIDNYGPNIFMFNKLLFNDDIETFSYFIENKNELFSIVTNHNYETSRYLLDQFIIFMDDNPSIDLDLFIKLSFYNNRKLGIRELLLSQIFNKSETSQIELFLTTLYNNNKTIEKFIINNIDDLTMIDFMDLVLKLYINNPRHHSTSMNNIIKEMMCNQNLDLSIKKEYAIIDDKDGFVNMRSGNNINYAIISKLSIGSKVQIYDKTDNWWYVKDQLGNKGYIHKSRLKEEK